MAIRIVDRLPSDIFGWRCRLAVGADNRFIRCRKSGVDVELGHRREVLHLRVNEDASRWMVGRPTPDRVWIPRSSALCSHNLGSTFHHIYWTVIMCAPS